MQDRRLDGLFNQDREDTRRNTHRATTRARDRPGFSGRKAEERRTNLSNTTPSNPHLFFFCGTKRNGHQKNMLRVNSIPTIRFRTYKTTDGVQQAYSRPNWDAYKSGVLEMVELGVLELAAYVSQSQNLSFANSQGY